MLPIISIVLCNSTLFNQGYDVGVIQSILRHKSPNTTERYLKSIGMERVRDALESLPSKPAEVVSINRVYKQMFESGMGSSLLLTQKVEWSGMGSSLLLTHVEWGQVYY